MLKLGTLVNVKNLAESLTKFHNHIRVVDATWFVPGQGKGIDKYKEGHIPGSVFFDLDACSAKSEYEIMLPSESQFSNYVGNLGIDNNTHVVIYNNHPTYALYSAPRVWWTFRVFGHNCVSILDGGIRKWKDENFPIAKGMETVPKKTFKAKFNAKFVKSFEDVAKNISSQEFQLVDARSAGRFHGTDPEPREDVKPGHILGSINVPFTKFLGPYKSPKDGELKYGNTLNVTEMRKVFENSGIDLNKPLIASCGSGVTACCIVLAAHLCGKDDVAVYDGAWLEWFKRSKPEQRICAS